MLCRECPVYMSTCGVTVSIDRMPPYTARSRSGTIAPSHCAPSTTGTNSPAMSASPAAAGSVMNASPSTTPRKYRRSAGMSFCTAENTPGVTLETSELMRSTGSVAISQPSVYAPERLLAEHAAHHREIRGVVGVPREPPHHDVPADVQRAADRLERRRPRQSVRSQPKRQQRATGAGDDAPEHQRHVAEAEHGERQHRDHLREIGDAVDQRQSRIGEVAREQRARKHAERAEDEVDAQERNDLRHRRLAVEARNERARSRRRSRRSTRPIDAR